MNNDGKEPLPQVLAITSLFCKDTELISLYKNKYIKKSEKSQYSI